MTSLYKYVGNSYLGKVLNENHKVTLKCAYPKDFNDPYELFLTINFNASPEILAFYSDVIGELPQIPTTCFSRSPLVIPMWAHYAQNHEGFAIEFDETELEKHFPKSGFGDVDYLDSPRRGLNDLLEHAFALQKPRYLHMLHSGVFAAAYYTKASCWSYEHERRMLVSQAETRSASDMILIDVPAKCVKALICGARASPETVTAIRARADQFGCSYFQLRIGRTSPVPYLTDAGGSSFTFANDGVVECGYQCASCGEPMDKDSEQCSWCQINESHKYEAASRNTFRLLAKYGLLDDYARGMREIDEKFRKRE